MIKRKAISTSSINIIIVLITSFLTRISVGFHRNIVVLVSNPNINTNRIHRNNDIFQSLGLGLYHHKRSSTIDNKLNKEEEEVPIKNRRMKHNKNRVIVVGSANVDYIGYTPTFPKGGETIISSSTSSTSNATFEIKNGGKGANQGIAAAKIVKDIEDRSVAVHMVCKVGRDQAGESIIRNLRANGVDVSHVLVEEEGVSSGVAMITVEESSGENCIVVHPGANAYLTAGAVRKVFDSFQDVEDESCKGVVLVQLEIPVETAMEALKVGKERGYITILNPAPVPPHDHPLPEHMWDYVDIVVPNEPEIQALLSSTTASGSSENAAMKEEDVDAVQSFMKSLQPRNKNVSIVNTVGSRGAVLLHHSSPDTPHRCHLPSSSNTPAVIDTVGAGDAFCGALAAYLVLCDHEGTAACSRESLIQATSFACAVASFSVGTKGAQSSYPTLNQLPSPTTDLLLPHLPPNSITSAPKPSITFITGNINKLKEVRRLLSSSSFRYKIKHTKLDLPELQGEDAQIIAIAKCEHAYNLLQTPVFIEDTSLSFNALGGLPGPYIKWFLERLGLQGLNQLLAGYEDKSGKATTIIAYKHASQTPIELFIGETTGSIVRPRGNTTFGWDAIFETKTKDGFVKTYGEMTMEEKNLVSHRGKAFHRMRDFFMNVE